ncbi:hypothetical protein, partial [Burkholderia vietnamiensis]|uniref:hypothetical protein n=1 Tax=Burkholderia vietnamiensis TaxID=60552 RepID=UPI001E48B47B
MIVDDRGAGVERLFVADCSFLPSPTKHLEAVSKWPLGAVNFRGELLTSGIETTETEEMGKPI